MKINKALIIALVLGSSSVAMARPLTFSASAEASWRIGTPDSRPTVRDHRYYEPVRRPVVVREPAMYPSNNIIGSDSSTYNGPTLVNQYGYHQNGWVAVTTPTRIDRGRQFINFNTQGSFRKLLLQNVAGRSFVSQVLVTFKDGSSEKVLLDQSLDRFNSTIHINLRGHREIDGVIVYGETAQGSAYQLLAK